MKNWLIFMTGVTTQTAGTAFMQDRFGSAQGYCNHLLEPGVWVQVPLWISGGVWFIGIAAFAGLCCWNSRDCR